MIAARESQSRPGLRHALAGLQAGVTGALVMLAWLMTLSFLVRRSSWLFPNLLATTFYGSNAYTDRFVRSSWAGLALAIVIYGILGMFWGLLWRDRQPAWPRVSALFFGLAVYFFLFHFFWKHVNPLVMLYTPDRQVEAGHLLWGLMLARTPVYARRIAASTGLSSNAQSELHEVRSGELIL